MRVLAYCLALTPLAFVASTALTTAWYEMVYLKRIAGED